MVSDEKHKKTWWNDDLNKFSDLSLSLLELFFVFLIFSSNREQFILSRLFFLPSLIPR